MENNLLLDDLYTLQDALIHYYYYGWDFPSHTPQTKNKIRIIQKKLLSMEKEHETK